MSIYKSFLSGMFLALLLVLSGCQGNNSESTDANGSSSVAPPIDINATTAAKYLSVVNGNKITVTGSGEERDVYIMAFNSSGSTNTAGNVTFQYPIEFIQNGTDVGTVSPGTATITDGIVHFVYKAPADLKARQDAGATGTQFVFYSTTSAAVNVTLYVDYNASGSIISGESTLENLVLSDSSLEVSASSQIVNLSLFAYNKNGTNNINTTLLVKYADDVRKNGLDVGYLPSEINVVNGRANFQYTGPVDLLSTITKINATGSATPITLTLYDKVNTGVSVDLNLSFTTTPIDLSTYTLSAVQKTLTISEGSQNKVVDLYLVDNKSRPVAGELILLDFFDAAKGTVNSYSATTDTNGHVAFNYTAPESVTTGALVTMTFRGANSTLNTATTVVTVDTTPAIDPKYNNYVLTVFPDNNLRITANSQAQAIDVYLEDNSTKKPVANEIVNLNFFDGSKGTMNSFSALTDVNGHVTFNYTAPANITGLADQNLTFTLNADNSVTDFTTVKFDEVTGNPKYVNYDIVTVVANKTIRVGSQEKVIDIYLKDGSGKLASNERILLDFFDGTNGTMDAFSAITDVNGHAVFNYTSPITVREADKYNLRFKLENSPNIDENLTFTVGSNVGGADYSDYNLSVLAPKTKIISSPNQTVVIDLYLEDMNKRPAANELILLDFFNGNKGTVSEHNDTLSGFSTYTDANGHVSFNYIAPSDLTDLNGTILTFRMDSNTSIKQTVTLNVIAVNPLQAKIHVENSDITLTTNAQAEVVRVLAFDENNQSLNSGTIIVRYPAEIVDQNINGGRFLESEVAIANGEAIFNFIGPNPLKKISTPLVFTFVYKQNETIQASLNVTYSPAIAKVIPLHDVNITLNNQVVNIDVLVLDGDNNPYPDGSVKIIYPSDILKGRDIGNFDNSTVNLVNGKATFVYTAPTLLDANTSDIVFSFYHDSQPAFPEKLTISINPDPNQVVLTTYYIKSSLVDTDVSVGLESNKFISFRVEDKNGIVVPDINMTSMTVTLLNTALGTLEDTASRTGSSLVFNATNNVTVNLKTNTISGVIPVKVVVNFIDVNNQLQTLTKIFNVLVFSGPPSAISFSYAGTISSDTNETLYTELQNRGKFAENWVVTVTDKYNNLINTNPAVSMGMMAGYAQSSANDVNNTRGYLYYKPSDGNGTIDRNGTIDAPNFTTKPEIKSSSVFGKVDLTNDYLVTFGNGYTYNASGKWDIGDIFSENNTSDSLRLVDQFEGNTTSNLGFAVGKNYRQDICEEGVEWVGNVYSRDNNYTIGQTGSMKMTVEYDYYMVGKDVMLWANMIGNQNSIDKTVRIGEAQKVTLRGLGLGDVDGKTSVVSVPRDTNETTHPDGFTIYIPVTETPTYYKNARFTYNIQLSDNLSLISKSDSNSNLGICSSYVNVKVRELEGKSGTITITNLVIANEF